MSVEVVGWVLLVMAVIPALSSSVMTGVTSTAGLFLVAVTGIAMIAGTGAGTREWMLGGGIALVLAGEVMYWRRRGRPNWPDRKRAQER